MSLKRLHVGNLSEFTSEQELRETFAEHGTVLSVTLPRDGGTGKLMGFGFVEYDTIEGAEVALLALNGSMLHGRLLSVDVARELAPHTTGQSST